MMGNPFEILQQKRGLPVMTSLVFMKIKLAIFGSAPEAEQAAMMGNPSENFTTKEGLPNNDVNSIVEDKTGKFWFGTRGKACIYDGKTFSIFTHGR